MRVLIVDDEKNIRRTLATVVETMGHEVSLAANGALALAEMRGKAFAAVLLDLRLSQESGLELLPEMLQLTPGAAIIMMTAYASIETAVEAMRRGAYDYLPKPCTPEQVRQVLARVEKTHKLERRVAELEASLAIEQVAADLTTRSPLMQKAFDVAFRAAESEATILLLGESGTGKSMLARAVHQRSLRRAGPFVTVSCPSLSQELLESELFGHAKGAFTGALTETWGKVAAAEGGTLFLDEIGELPLAVQARLLRLLQEREYERVGETKSRRAEVRIISATNRDLAAAVATGTFREDLWYRLNVISLRLPPLRERSADVEALTTQLLAHFAQRLGRPAKTLSPEALASLRGYAWPGNLRELRNAIERAVILSNGAEIGSADLPELLLAPGELRLGGDYTLEQIEEEHLRRVLAQAQTLERAAQVLGIDPATLYRRRKKLEERGASS